jgi:hypothetical protein
LAASTAASESGRSKREEQEAFVFILEALLATWAEDWELLFVDETKVRRYPALTAQWCLVDEVPEVPTSDDHAKVHIYGAIAPLTSWTHYHISRELGKVEFAWFLEHLLAYPPGKRRLVIRDRSTLSHHR